MTDETTNTEQSRISADCPNERIVMPLTVPTVVQAIQSIGDEAARRGEMYPQTADEQRKDKAAVRRVIEMLEWYDKNTGCHRIDGWPSA